MKRILSLLFLALMYGGGVSMAADSTLRLDYVLGVSAGKPVIMLHEAVKMPGWGGRCVNLDSAVAQGNGQVRVTDARSGKLLYVQPFSTLFQEWLCIPGSDTVGVSFEHTAEVPLPDGDAVVELLLFDRRGDVECRHVTRYSPADVMVREVKRPSVPMKVLHESDHKSPISVAILAEGYTEAEMERFYDDARKFVDEVLGYEPFCRYADRFRFTAVALPSGGSGVSIPHDGLWLDTPMGSHFDTFGMERYLTAPRIWDMYTAADAAGAAHIMVLANTDEYGGGGIFNSYALTAAHTPQVGPVAVHEFGHSFGGLADEYFYEGEVIDDTYPLDVEPWEPNITTLADFGSKWEADSASEMYEGGGYRAKGIYRAAYDCRMRTNESPAFCKACSAWLERMIRYLTEE